MEADDEIDPDEDSLISGGIRPRRGVKPVGGFYHRIAFRIDGASGRIGIDPKRRFRPVDQERSGICRDDAGERSGASRWR
jgi:hypothetical protein